MKENKKKGQNQNKKIEEKNHTEKPKNKDKDKKITQKPQEQNKNKNENSDRKKDHIEVFDNIDGDDTIFRNKELLKIAHIPEKNRIVGREEEMNNIAKELYPITKNNSPDNCILYGKTGTGKSLVARHVAKGAKYKAQENKNNIGMVYVDCSEHNTHTRAVTHIALTLNNENLDLDIPRNGIGSAEYYRYIWEILDKQYDGVIIILDEIDKLPNDDILMQFSRAREAQKTKSNIGIISISNKLQYRDKLNERVKSSIDARDFIFHPYDAEELKMILKKRKDAFYEGVLESDVIPLVAALSAKEHGDARKAIEILRNAGKIAEEEKSGNITEKHVHKAKDRAEMNRFYESIKGSTQHVQYLLYTLAELTLKRDHDLIYTSDIYETYRKVCGKHGTDPVGRQRAYEYLKEQAFLGVIEQKKVSKGKSKGVELKHRLVTDPEIVKNVLEKTKIGDDLQIS